MTIVNIDTFTLLNAHCSFDIQSTCGCLTKHIEMFQIKNEMFKPHLFPSIQMNLYKTKRNMSSKRIERQRENKFDCQAVNQNSQWAVVNELHQENGHTVAGERKKITTTAPTTEACQIWMKYAKSQYSEWFSSYWNI